jgi:tripartite-type tricarboxylate transporter receptor subunit TctC
MQLIDLWRSLRRAALGLIAEVAAMAASLGASAQVPYLTKPVALIVPYGPGSSTDILARIVARRMAQHLGQPFSGGGLRPAARAGNL